MTGENVQEVFSTLAQRILSKVEQSLNQANAEKKCGKEEEEDGFLEDREKGKGKGVVHEEERKDWCRCVGPFAACAT